MTRQELDVALARLGLKVPEAERGDIADAVRFIEEMTDLDVILTATTSSEAPKIDAVGKFSIFERPLSTSSFNVTGSPAMSVCCGYTEAGLPLSMQIIGKRFDDATVLRLADAYERATAWRERRPCL